MKKKEIAKRYVLFIISLFFSALGVAFTKHAELGVSPISAVANVLSIEYQDLSLGTWLIIWNTVLIIGQILILRRDFEIIQLLQLPLSFLFGIFTDIALSLVSSIPIQSYLIKLLLVLIGVIILAFGIALSVVANVIMNSGEAFVKAISDKAKKKFGDVKVIFDICCVLLALTLSLIFFDFHILGIREGTLITALITGFIVKGYIRVLKDPLTKILQELE